MRRSVATMVLLGLVAGCGGAPAQSAGDCAQAIRKDGAVYVERGFTDLPATPAGHADTSECADNGEQPRGVYFTDEPAQLDVWSFEGQDPREALGVRESNGTYRVFVAEGADAARILDALASPVTGGRG